jgi:hypothetical protein
MIMPGPTRRHIDLEADAAAQALALRRLARRNRCWLFYRRAILWEHLKSLGLRRSGMVR